MIHSMTGFGKAELELDAKKISIEIKALNSKSMDLNVRLPFQYNEKDIEIRNLVSQQLHRGKVYVNINFENFGKTSNYNINTDLAVEYYKSLQKINAEIGQEGDFHDFLPVIMRMPEVVSPLQDSVDENEWTKMKVSIQEAIDALNDFRLEEGKGLEADFKKRTQKILDLLEEVIPFEKSRIEEVRAKMMKELEKFQLEVDKNRFEQELVYYIEKLDITEEKVRLRKHCSYFIENIENKEMAKGKKLGFILQEMGREINTLGSKSNHQQMQQIVVQMKDELEKMKEQVLNIL
jgi:uncharacterized protein (TIGR00255 family)